MIYLNSLTFKNDYRNLTKGFTIPLREITLLVGDQGSGKSTVLTLLKQADSTTLDIDLTDFTKNRGVNSYYFDTESMNPRVSSLDDYTTPSGASKGIGVAGFLQSKFQSHGQVMELFTVEMLPKAKDSVILLDEPESGLSIKNQYKLIKGIEKAKDNRCQLVIASHCIPVIQHFNEVFDMEKGLWVSSKDYLDSFKSLKK